MPNSFNLLVSFCHEAIRSCDTRLKEKYRQKRLQEGTDIPSISISVAKMEPGNPVAWRLVQPLCLWLIFKATSSFTC